MHSKNLTANGLTRWQGAIAKLLVLSLLLVGARNALAERVRLKRSYRPKKPLFGISGRWKFLRALNVKIKCYW